MSRITVESARTQSEIKEWVRFPRQQIYARDSPWAPPLDRDLLRTLDRAKNPFFRYGEAIPFLARDTAGRVLGRVLAHVYHRHTVRHGERVAFFGYFECVNDDRVAAGLIDQARQFGQQRSCALLRGPFNMTAMQEMGILVDGFEEAPSVDETYTAPFYPTLLEATGLKRIFPVTTFRIDDLSRVDPDAPLAERHRQLVAEGNFKVRPSNPKQSHREFEILRELLNDSFYDNPYFVPITEDEFEFQVGPYKRLMDPAISLVAEQEGVPCGFVTTVPDFNPLLKQMNGSSGPVAILKFLLKRKKIRDASLIVMGVQRQLQGKGVMRLIHAELLRALRQRKYKSLTITWIADVNGKSLGTMRSLGARPLHHLTLYEGPIAATA